jgi:archaellum component FlaC
MGTYFALMDEAAKHGKDYETLDQISDVLRKLETCTATPDEVKQVIEVLNGFEKRIAALANQSNRAGAIEDAAGDRVKEALEHLESLKKAIQSVAGFSWSAARR